MRITNNGCRIRMKQLLLNLKMNIVQNTNTYYVVQRTRMQMLHTNCARTANILIVTFFSLIVAKSVIMTCFMSLQSSSFSEMYTPFLWWGHCSWDHEKFQTSTFRSLISKHASASEYFHQTNRDRTRVGKWSEPVTPMLLSECFKSLRSHRQAWLAKEEALTG